MSIPRSSRSLTLPTVSLHIAQKIHDLADLLAQSALADIGLSDMQASGEVGGNDVGLA